MLDFDELWNYDQLSETEQRFRERLPAAEEAGNMDYLAQLLTQLARTCSLQRRFDEAHAFLDRAETLITADLPIAHIRYLLERGRTYNSNKQVEQARPLFLQAYELGAAVKADFYTIDAAHMMGIIEPPQQQLEWNTRAIALAEQTADPHARDWLASLYNNTGWAYYDMEQYEAALDIFQRAWEYRKTRGNNKRVRIARWCVAKTLRALQRVEEALAIQRELEAEQTTLNEPDGYTFEEIAECLLFLGQAEAARPYFGRAYEILAKDEWLKENEPARLQRLKMLWQNA